MTKVTFILLAGATALLGCGSPSKMFEGDTVRETTARLDYNLAAHSHEEAQSEVRQLCGAAEVLSVSQPMLLTPDTFRVSAECLSTFDKYGNQIENDIENT